MRDGIVTPYVCGVLLGVFASAAPCEEERFLPPKTFGTMGKQRKPLEGGREAELFCHDGKGCLTHMWFGGSWPGYGRTRIRIYVDGEDKAYYLGTNYFNRGKFVTPMAGVTCLRKERDHHLFSAYRFHDKDPVFFQKGLRLACKCGEKIDGTVYHRDPAPTEYTTYVWVYEW